MATNEDEQFPKRIKQLSRSCKSDCSKSSSVFCNLMAFSFFANYLQKQNKTKQIMYNLMIPNYV